MEFSNEQLNVIFPFHVLFDDALQILHHGPGIKKIFPEMERGKSLNDFLDLKAPFIPFTFENLLSRENKLLVFAARDRELQLKGQVLSFPGMALVILSPAIIDSPTLKRIGITLRDFANYDNITDTLILLNAQKMALNESKQFSAQLLESNQELEKVNKDIVEINESLEQKVKDRTREIQQTLNDLNATQSQLIHAEKMASLGELTAGIAHEIQNPLNFVNNFSEVNEELLQEMKEELAKGHIDEAGSIANDAIANQQKIIFHGKRADAIVKGMLLHSRSSNGIKELTDINTLAEEYLRLAYHGLRAKDKTFNATIKLDLDPNIGPVHIVPQDIGRVMLNLITNAFYACTERVKSEGLKAKSEEFKPTVTVSTKNLGHHIEICVKDNGGGIPRNVIDKIFQPFFTTKPSGQGTGLGLSLSYDIVKAHGGELKVQTQEGEGTGFTISLPK
jgi:signal transduction histidine kinase